MKRNVSALAEREYDLVIVGGGIFGVCIAWDAVLRGLSVALVERGDFAHASSANCFKMVHGGIRYLQHADLHRIRESSNDRNALLRIAPHLVTPLPFVVPTYGHGKRGKEILRAGLAAYNLITFDRNRDITDPQRRIPPGFVLTRSECLELFPGVKKERLTGGVVFYDAQMYSPARLAVSYLKSAVEAGAHAVNYVETTGFIQKKNRVCGIRVRDLLGMSEIDVRGRMVVNAAGPWASSLLKTALGFQLTPEPMFSRDAFFLVRGRLNKTYALALESTTKDADAILSRGHRHLFLVPWRDYTLIGVWHRVHKGEPSRVTLSTEDLEKFIEEINAAYPDIAVTLQDVCMWHAGLILFGDDDDSGSSLSYGKRSQFIDHSKIHGTDGILTIIGVRYTTARSAAEGVVDLICRRLGRKPRASTTAVTPVYGGQIEKFEVLLRDAIAQAPFGLNSKVMTALVHNYGARYGDVLEYAAQTPALRQMLGSSGVVKAEVVYAVRAEMAQKLTDVVFRRTNLGTGEYPGDSVLQACAVTMASELGWNRQRLLREIEEVRSAFPHIPDDKSESKVSDRIAL